jgi:O-antigen biosynthesis protein
MSAMPTFSPLTVEYEKKYQDRPRQEVVALLEFPFRSVLEIGCGNGATGQAVKQQFPGTYYCGVELDQVAAQHARKVLDRVITGDIERMDLEHYDLIRSPFDVIVCADVLEHLYDPWNVVQKLHQCLATGGRIIASIPNVQNARVLHNLVGGRWTYTDQGLLDATHIRFFTLYEIGQMFVRNGYEVEQVISSCDPDMPTTGPWPRDVDLGLCILKQVSEKEVQQIFTFQYLVRARNMAKPGGEL